MSTSRMRQLRQFNQKYNYFSLYNRSLRDVEAGDQNDHLARMDSLSLPLRQDRELSSTKCSLSLDINDAWNILNDALKNGSADNREKLTNLKNIIDNTDYADEGNGSNNGPANRSALTIKKQAITEAFEALHLACKDIKDHITRKRCLYALLIIALAVGAAFGGYALAPLFIATFKLSAATAIKAEVVKTAAPYITGIIGGAIGHFIGNRCFKYTAEENDKLAAKKLEAPIKRMTAGAA